MSDLTFSFRHSRRCAETSTISTSGPDRCCAPILESLLTFFVAALCLVACNSPALAQFKPGVPALKVVAPNGKQSTLIGSLHVAMAALRQPDTSVFKGARRYVIEHHGGTPAPSENFAPGNTLAPWAVGLSDEELRTYFDRARCAGLTQEQARRKLSFRSAQEANQYAYTVCGVAVAVPSRDVHMAIAAARRPDLKVEVLEDTDWIEEHRHNVPLDAATAGFRWILRRDPNAVLSEIVDSLNAGDYERIASATRASFGGSEGAVRYEELMVRDRNLAWMPRLRQFLDDGDAVVLVGAMHLPGPNGLIVMLSSQGYKVTRIVLPASR
jgi:uncharacterized protein YbaP (TraB family)